MLVLHLNIYLHVKRSFIIRQSHYLRVTRADLQTAAKVHDAISGVVLCQDFEIYLRDYKFITV